MASPRRTTLRRLEKAQASLGRARLEFDMACDLVVYRGLTRAAAKAKLVQDCHHTTLVIQGARSELQDARKSHYGTLRMTQFPKRLRSEARLGRERCSANKAGRRALARRAKRIERMRDELRSLAGRGYQVLAAMEQQQHDLDQVKHRRLQEQAQHQAEVEARQVRIQRPRRPSHLLTMFRPGDAVEHAQLGRGLVQGIDVDAVVVDFPRGSRRFGVDAVREGVIDLAADSASSLRGAA